MPSGIEYISTSGVQVSIPPAAGSVTLTPNASAWANSSYAQLTASTSFAAILKSITVTPFSGAADQSNLNVISEFEIDIATGAAASEVVIATIIGVTQGNTWGGCPNVTLELPIPVENIAASARLSWRLRKGNTSVVIWGCAATVINKPVTGNISTTTNVPSCLPSGADGISIFSPVAVWGNSAYTQITASTSGALVLAGLAWLYPAGTQCEIDIATGGAGSETVITTFRHQGNSSGQLTPGYIPLRPLLDNIANGVRISVRVRADDQPFQNTFNHSGMKILYYAKSGLGSVNNLLGTKPLKWYPAATTIGLNAQSGTNWVNGSYLELAASTGAAIQISQAVILHGSGIDNEFDLAKGAAASEVVIGTGRIRCLGNTGGNQVHQFPYPIDNIPSGQRVSFRVRGNNTTTSGLGLAIGYYEALDAGLKTSNAPAAFPPAADNVSITPNASAWANSSWTQLSAGIASLVEIFSIPFAPGVTSASEFELDIGIGAGGSEVVAVTLRNYSDMFTYTGMICNMYNSIPYAIPLSTRIAYRMRKAGTDVTAWTFAANYYSASTSAGGGPGSGANPGKGGGKKGGPKGGDFFGPTLGIAWGSVNEMGGN